VSGPFLQLFPLLSPSHWNSPGLTKQPSCFNNCPDDNRKATYEGQRQIFCGYASQYPSSTSKPFSAPLSATPSVPTTSADSAAAEETTTSSTATSTGSAASASKTNSAADLALNAGGILAAVAGVVAAVL